MTESKPIPIQKPYQISQFSLMAPQFWTKSAASHSPKNSQHSRKSSNLRCNLLNRYKYLISLVQIFYDYQCGRSMLS